MNISPVLFFGICDVLVSKIYQNLTKAILKHQVEGGAGIWNGLQTNSVFSCCLY